MDQDEHKKNMNILELLLVLGPTANWLYSNLSCNFLPFSKRPMAGPFHPKQGL